VSYGDNYWTAQDHWLQPHPPSKPT
jgi:hypothetical protein